MRIKKRSHKHFNGVAENDDGPVEGGAFIYVLVIYYLRNETMIFFSLTQAEIKNSVFALIPNRKGMNRGTIGIGI